MIVAKVHWQNTKTSNYDSNLELKWIYTVQSVKCSYFCCISRCNLHPLLPCMDDPLHGQWASVNELWGNISAPRQLLLQQMHTPPGGPEHVKKVIRITPPTKRTFRCFSVCFSGILTYCWIVFGWSKPRTLSLMTTAFSWTLRALEKCDPLRIIIYCPVKEFKGIYSLYY